MKGVYTKVALLLAGVLAACVFLTALSGHSPAGNAGGEGTLRVTATFYPVYIAALNVAGGIDAVEVVCLTQPTTGCLHDYQLSPSDLTTLAQTDVLVMNGAGAEPFLEGALARFPQLPVIDSAAGVALLESQEEHDHGEDDPHDHNGEEHDHGVYNEHIWMSPSRYKQQIVNIRDGLCREDPAHADAYRANAAAYLEKVEAVTASLTEAAAALPYRDCVLFHDSLAYLSEDLGLRVLQVLPVGEEAGLSASELAQAKALIEGREVLLLYDSQYRVVYDYLSAYPAACRTLTIDTAVSGELLADAWLTAMTKTANQLRGTL